MARLPVPAMIAVAHKSILHGCRRLQLTAFRKGEPEALTDDVLPAAAFRHVQVGGGLGCFADTSPMTVA